MPNPRQQCDPENLYSAIPGLWARDGQLKRSIKGCVPRICYLHVTKVEALTQLTRSKSEVRIVAVMSDGRSRLRDGVRSARLKRAALSSAFMPVQMSPTCSIPVNINFYMQYFHNLRSHGDNLRILLQKKSKRSLVYKVIAECAVVLADVLQGPLDEGSHLILMSTGRLKHSPQAGAINTPLVRLHVQLESLTVDSTAITKWWPSDKGDDSEHTPNLDGILSGEDLEEDDEDEHEWTDNRAEEEDEWVETHQILSARGGLSPGAEEEACGALSDEAESAIPSLGVHAEDIAGPADAPTRNNFRRKVLNGTRKIALMTLHPIRTVKNGYARIRSRTGKSSLAASSVSGPEGEPTDEGEDFPVEFPVFADFDDHEEGEDGPLWVPWDDGEDDEREEEDAPLFAAQVTEILRQQLPQLGGAERHWCGHEGDGPFVVLLNTRSRRGALLHDWLVSEDEEAAWAEHGAVRSPLRANLVAAPDVKHLRAALRAILAHQQELAALDRGRSTAGPGAPGLRVRVAILGGDLYTHNVVREWVRLRQPPSGTNTKGKEQPAAAAGAAGNLSAGNMGAEGVRFFLVPLGTKGRESTLSLQLAARDPHYGNLFLSDHWIELWESLAQNTHSKRVDKRHQYTHTHNTHLLDAATPDAIGSQIEDFLMQYLQGARDSFKINIAEVFVTCSSFVDAAPSTPGATSPGQPQQHHSEIVRQHTLPFISHLSFRAEEPAVRDTSASSSFSAEGADLGGLGLRAAAAAAAAGTGVAGSGDGTGHMYHLNEYDKAVAYYKAQHAMGTELGLAHMQSDAASDRTLTPILPHTSATHPLSSSPQQYAGSPMPPLPLLMRSTSPLGGGQPMDINLDFWVGVAGDLCKTSARGPYLDLQAVSVCRGTSYLEKNRRVRSQVNVVERERGGGTVIKADISRLICHCPSKTHFSVTVDGVRLNAVRFVAVSPHLSSSYTKTFPIATFSPQRGQS